MNISLIYPLLSKARSRVDENKQYWPPLGLAYIAAVLRKNGHSVQILDRDLILRKNKLDFDKTDEITLGIIKDFGAQILGFSATTPNISDVNEFSKQVKKMDAGITTVIGGPHCAGEPVTTLQICCGIDMLVRGEGEMAMLDIANGIPVDAIASLTYRKPDGSIVSNPDRPLIESLDSLPFPARDLLDMSYYTRPSRFISRNLSLRTTHLFTARGCPFNCHYCAGPLIGQRTVRYHSPQRVVSEAEELINKYSVEAIYFAEDMFLSNRKRALEMMNMFIERGINKKIAWIAQINPNATDRELLASMKKAGCVHVEYGFESGSQRILDLMNKKTNVGRNKAVAALTKKSGLRFQGNFIVGYPGEKEADFKETMAFIKETRPNNVSLNIFMPLPGTQIYKQLKAEGGLLSNWDDIGNPEAPQINYADMPPTHFEKLYFNAKLRVVLPLNLFHFIKDNITHPVRLFYVAVTQFKSVITRAFKAVNELHRIKAKDSKEVKVLFIAYHPASYPIMESQGFAYMRGLSKEGVRYSLLTFETKESMDDSQKRISEIGMPVKWRHLFFHRRPRFLASCFNIICGILATAFIVKKDKVKIIHSRGLIAALIAFLPSKLIGAKFFFDTRGLLADKYVGGGLLSSQSLTYRLMRIGEDYLLKKSNYFTVETNKHAQMIKSSGNGIYQKMDVIPCCVDMHKFNYVSRTDMFDKKDQFRLVYAGKVGTWYLVDEIFGFFKTMSESIPRSNLTFLTESNPASIYSGARKNQVSESKIDIKKAQASEVPELLAAANAGIFFINPYKRYNSSPIKFGEYLACGLPVIVNSGIGDCDEIILKERVGVIINNFSAYDYKAAIKDLNCLLAEGDILRKRCRIAAEKYFSLEMGVFKYRQVYQRLIGDK